jgi:hypothetical protein
VADDLADTLLLLDPAHGARGMRAQLAELVEIHRPEAVTVLDVGGDALARGDEPGLRSPLADALSLAAATGLDVPVTVLVAGPGLDGELNEAQVLDITGTEAAYGLTAGDVEPFRVVLDWHPSEATALLAAAACGLRGRVEVRDAGLTVDLTDRSASIYRLSLSDVLGINPLAVALADTTSLDQAEDITRQRLGFSEIDYERAKHQRSKSVDRHPSTLSLDAAVHDFEREAAQRGVSYVTFRRIAEAVRPIQVDRGDATPPHHHTTRSLPMAALVAQRRAITPSSPSTSGLITGTLPRSDAPVWLHVMRDGSVPSDGRRSA